MMFGMMNARKRGRKNLKNYRKRRIVSFTEGGVEYQLDPHDPLVREACLELGIEYQYLKKKRLNDFDDIDISEEIKKIRFKH